MRMMMRTASVTIVLATLIMASMAPFAAAAPGAPGSGVNSELAAARQATAKYHDVNEALADGYVPVTPHIPGMGVHYINFALLDAVFDIGRPEILLYSMAEGNGPKLVAVEYVAVVPTSGFAGDSDVWDTHSASCHYADGYEEVQPAPVLCPPTSPGGAPLVLWHPDLFAVHAWIWRSNPDGVFAPFNPNVP